MPLSQNRKRNIAIASMLSQEEKDMLRDLSMKYMEEYLVIDRPRPSTLLKKVITLKTRDKIIGDLIKETQTELLSKEIDNYMNIHEKRTVK